MPRSVEVGEGSFSNGSAAPPNELSSGKYIDGSIGAVTKSKPPRPPECPPPALYCCC